MKVSVVIATRNRASLLAAALDSLAVQQDACPFEVVVADNGSCDDTAGVVEERSARYPARLKRVFVANPNRSAARNRGVEATDGDVLLFTDDDVIVPPHFLQSHAKHHQGETMTTVSGPIINVPSSHMRPTPTLANASRAFFCTCNASLGRSAFERAGGFDERFELYGWEDTDLGIRLRRIGTRRVFAWDAYLYHVKSAAAETLDDALSKAAQKGSMAARLIAKDPTARTRLATGAHAANLARVALFAPAWTLPWYERLAREQRVPGALRAFARAQALDGTYVRALKSALRSAPRGAR